MSGNESESLVLGKYKILEEIGRGGMGIVYKAQDIRIERIVALKELIVNPALAKEKDEIIARFHREARTAGSLQHPNIVTIHDFGEHKNRHYIAMEYIEGKSVKDCMEDGANFTDEQIIDIMLQICEGLQHAHDRGIIHRDIKPDNISIMQSGKIKITDFGIARMTDAMVKMTQDGTMLGTLGYISPEQLQDSRSVDHRADIFSLGAMLYELYTRELPFDGGNVGATILKIVSEDPPPPSQINPKMPPGMEEIILKALQKDKDKRYQSAKAFAADLEKIKALTTGEGSEQQVACSNCQTHILASAKFCPNCGTPNVTKAPSPPRRMPIKISMEGTPPPEKPVISYRPDTPPSPPVAPQEQEASSFKDRLAQLAQITNIYQKKSQNTTLNLPPVHPTEIEIPAENSPPNENKENKIPPKPLFPFEKFKQMKNQSDSTQESAKKPDFASIINDQRVTQATVSSSLLAKKEEMGKSGAFTVDFVRKIGQIGAGKGQFSQPRGLAIYQGLIFVADTQNHRIQVFSKFGDWQYLIQVGAEKELLKTPSNITLDRQGHILVLDGNTCRVGVFDQSGRFLRAFGSQGKSRGELSNPYGLAITTNGDVYVGDTENSRIQVFNFQGQPMKILGKHGTRPGEFKSPYALALDDKENIYVLDYGFPRVQVLDRHGICRLEFGKRGVRDGEFSIPRGLAIDIKGRIYVADTLNHRIQIFDNKGQWIYTFGTKGRSDGQFWGPESITVSEDGEIFVLDKGNSRVQVFKCKNW